MTNKNVKLWCRRVSLRSCHEGEYNWIKACKGNHSYVNNDILFSVQFIYPLFYNWQRLSFDAETAFIETAQSFSFDPYHARTRFRVAIFSLNLNLSKYSRRLMGHCLCLDHYLLQRDAMFYITIQHPLHGVNNGCCRFSVLKILLNNFAGKF